MRYECRTGKPFAAMEIPSTVCPVKCMLDRNNCADAVHIELLFRWCICMVNGRVIGITMLHLD